MLDRLVQFVADVLVIGLARDVRELKPIGSRSTVPLIAVASGTRSGVLLGAPSTLEPQSRLGGLGDAGIGLDHEDARRLDPRARSSPW
jgi:hypothetical protein